MRQNAQGAGRRAPFRARAPSHRPAVCIGVQPPLHGLRSAAPPSVCKEPVCSDRRLGWLGCVWGAEERCGQGLEEEERADAPGLIVTAAAPAGFGRGVVLHVLGWSQAQTDAVDASAKRAELLGSGLLHTWLVMFGLDATTPAQTLLFVRGKVGKRGNGGEAGGRAAAIARAARMANESHTNRKIPTSGRI